MNLTIKIETDFNIKPELDSKLVIKELQKQGLIILNEKKFEFTENYNFTTHSGKNKMKVFHPLLRGNLEVKSENEFNSWNLQIESILIKSIFLTVFSFLLYHFVIESVLLFSILLSVFNGAILFLINRVRLNARVKTISENIKIELM